MRARLLAIGHLCHRGKLLSSSGVLGGPFRSWSNNEGATRELQRAPAKHCYQFCGCNCLTT